jgi:general secretion pathway protein L
MTELTRSWTYPLRRRATASFRWWVRELRSLIPGPVRRAFGGGRQRLILTLEADEVALTQVGDGGRETVGRYPLTRAAESTGRPLRNLARTAEVILCLPDHQTLVQRLTLPAAVEENLHRVLGYMMDRNTPFTADQVYYDGHITGRNRDKGLLEVELALAPRAFVDETLGQIKVLGLEPDRVAVGCGPERGTPQMNLLPPERRPRRLGSWRGLNGALAALALALLVALLLLPLWDGRQQVQSLEEQLERVSQEAQIAARLRERLDRLALEASFLEEKRRATPLVLSVMSELTRLLPDDTWLSDLRIETGEVQLTGYSAEAAALIPILDASPIFSNVRFLAPVTQNRLSEQERFQLSAAVTQETPP